MGFHQTQTFAQTSAFRPVRAGLPARKKTADTPVFRNDQFENRLIAAQTLTNLSASVPRKKVEFTYDYMSRRVSKTVYSGLTNNNYQITNNASFLYDGWNLISELITDNGSLTTNSYTWGLDLSGSLQGAGGIGGLISASFGGTTSTSSVLYCYDANGNVSELVDSQFGSIAAHYEYSPFGETVVATGPLAKANPFRFSTKYTDDEIAMLYYGYRFYSPSVGRWASRDPIGEEGGLNLVEFAANASICKFDALGLREIKFVFYHDFSSDELPSASMTIAENILTKCFQSCDKCKSHTYKYEWIAETSKDSSSMSLGMSGGNFFGFSPTRVGMHIFRAKKAKYAGMNYERWKSWINPDVVKASPDYVGGMGILIIHEAVYHGVGTMYDSGSGWRISTDKDGEYVDDPSPKSEVARELSPGACKEISDRLDIETP